jgi:hypothetical protein
MSFYRQEMEKQKKKIERSCTERLDLMETCMERKNHAELEEIKSKHEARLASLKSSKDVEINEQLNALNEQKEELFQELQQAREKLDAAAKNQSAFEGRLKLDEETLNEDDREQMECDGRRVESTNLSIQTSFVKDLSDLAVQTETVAKSTVGTDVNITKQHFTLC